MRVRSEASGGMPMRYIVAWLFGFVMVLLLCQVFAPSLVDIFFETLGELW